MANQFRNFILTINNPIQTDSEFAEYLKTLEHIKYYIFQREKGEENGTPHIQLYIEFEQGKRFDKMKKDFPTAHIENRKGTKTQARDYCSKEDTRIGEVYEYGEFAEERERTDLTDIMAMIEDGATDREVRDAYPSQFFRYYKNIEHLRQIKTQLDFGNKRRKLEVYYIYGSAGVGKTSFVLDKYGDDKVFRMTDYGEHYNNERFDNYIGQDIILFEEFRSSIKISNMLNYLDIYPLQLPARFFNKTACYTKVYLVTNIPLCEQYSNVQKESPETWRAFLRRITDVYDFNKSKETPLEHSMWKLIALSKQESEQLPF